MGRIVALILAGGTGERMGSGTPKQLLDLAGKPVIIHTLLNFEHSAKISDIIVVSNPGIVTRVAEEAERYGVSKLRDIVPGGATRQASSRIGVRNCPEDTDIILIHDAVRPLAGPGLIDDIVCGAISDGACIPAVAVKDTMVESSGDYIGNVPDRGRMMSVQTPQGFRRDLIQEAHMSAEKGGIKDATDDSCLVLAMGAKVRIARGDERNLKITGPVDLALAGCLLAKN
ncbi:MAG: 2-C-methyl-D-erythritol 4-phosphate cytidylyltransferase [Candidatus Omnitrophica bacterium]|nr:2-C-methyl-D-erythritol 4-phosphate cytidylyltransferase [Candidatus Omnitrophota bacterium]